MTRVRRQAGGAVSQTRQSEVGPLRQVALRHARDAFGSPERVAEQWRALGYGAPPDFDEACREYDEFARLLEDLGSAIVWLDGTDPSIGLDSIYVRDATVVSDAGVVLCAMGKEARRGEPAAQGRRLANHGVETVGRIEGPGATLEGGDVAWLDRDTLAVGRGYRTSSQGIDALQTCLPGVDVIRVPLPHWRGPADVFHLMSILSPLAEDLLLVHEPLLPVPFRERLLAMGFDLVDVPAAELDSQGCNVLAVAPRVAMALEGSPETRRRMEAAGVEVHTYRGREISLKGSGGPTCLTRPLERG